jgi:5-methylcytosine-specific restriction endonuclease McrA
MKTCSCCGERKDVALFVKSKSRPDGLHPYCKQCHNAKSVAWVAANKAKRHRIATTYALEHKEEKLAQARLAYHADIERQRARSARRRIEHAASEKARIAKWGKENPGRRNASTAIRRAKLKSATPSWANKVYMRDMYVLAKLVSEFTGETHEVDHIVPLQNRRVCGLHVEHNLRVIHKTDNRQKSNRHAGV